MIGLVILALLTSACRAITQAPPPPTPIPLRLAYTPAIHPWIGLLGHCAARQPDTAIFIEERPFDSEEIQSYDAFLRLGALDEYTGFAAILGYEQIELVLNPANPINQLDTNSLNNLFTGMLATWEPLSEPPGVIFTTTVQIWSYLPENELRDLPLQDNLPATSLLAYDPGQVIQGVAAEPGAVGFVPSGWLDNSNARVNVAGLPPELHQDLHLPVLAFSISEPQGALRTLLACASQQGN